MLINFLSMIKILSLIFQLAKFLLLLFPFLLLDLYIFSLHQDLSLKKMLLVKIALICHLFLLCLNSLELRVFLVFHLIYLILYILYFQDLKLTRVVHRNLLLFVFLFHFLLCLSFLIECLYNFDNYYY